MPAPIALFVYNRPLHTAQTLRALAGNALALESELFVFSDGPRTPGDAQAVTQVREEVAHLTGFAKVHVMESTVNRGLANSIIGGVSTVLTHSPTVIVLEDDLVTSPSYLKFINEGLQLYNDDERVASIHGYSPPTRRPLPKCYFLRGADCWGWGTWARAWSHFQPSAQLLLSELRRRGLARDFNFRGTRRMVKMLTDNAAGKNNSWAIRWHASAFIDGMYTLHPGSSLVDNIGFDGSGSHCDTRQDFRFGLKSESIDLERIAVEEDPSATDELIEFYTRLRRRQVVRKVWPWLERLFRQYDTRP